MSPLSESSAGDSELQHARPHPMRSLAILGLAALSFALAQTTLIPALAELMEEFHTDSTGIAWVLTGYLISAAIFTPIRKSDSRSIAHRASSPKSSPDGGSRYIAASVAPASSAC